MKQLTEKQGLSQDLTIKDFFGDDIPAYQRHGGPYDRGSADRFYGRPFKPHYFVGATYDSKKIPMEKMTAEEIALYKRGWTECTERKAY